jgi:hypothetical protein
MSFKMIRLKDLIPLREAEGDEEEAGGKNPFAAADSGGEEEGGEEDAKDTAKGEKEGEEEADTKAAKPQEPKHPIEFNISKVKKYNKANFLSNQGELKSISKQGVIVTVLPDNVDVFVNFDDITN